MVRGFFRRGKLWGEFSPALGIPKLQHLHYAADIPEFRRGKISPPSLKTTFSGKVMPPRSPPPPPLVVHSAALWPDTKK